MPIIRRPNCVPLPIVVCPVVAVVMLESRVTGCVHTAVVMLESRVASCV